MSTLENAENGQNSPIADNPEKLREIERIIASAIIVSSDGYVLMGRKDPTKGGVYPDAWHIPGGGIEDGESLEDAVIREVREEVGLNVDKEQLKASPLVGEGATVKIVDGERVWCRMKFNRFDVRLPEPAAVLAQKTQPSDDLVELRWFSPAELPYVEQIPGGKEFFEQASYIQPEA